MIQLSNIIPYKFQVVKDESVNAFATAGGFVYITTGLLKAADNEAQLTSVLAQPVPARRTLHLRFNNLTEPESIPHNTNYASVFESDVLIVM